MTAVIHGAAVVNSAPVKTTNLLKIPGKVTPSQYAGDASHLAASVSSTFSC